jgi:hypothetical protein
MEESCARKYQKWEIENISLASDSGFLTFSLNLYMPCVKTACECSLKG